MEEDNIDPLVAPPHLTRRRHHYIIHHPSIYSTCAHTYVRKPTRPQPLLWIFYLFSSICKDPIFFLLLSPFLLLFHRSNPRRSISWLQPKTRQTKQCWYKAGMWEAATRDATSLKINSVKEPPDIRGFAKDLTPQDPTSECASIHNSQPPLYLSSTSEHTYSWLTFSDFLQPNW